ncbi:F-box protein [Rhizoctonia solani AG-3 Rhs1AP]|uniref:F-box protein n=1 Tax=Rhizoctonia solani AG-3 Rhs1AP TaxID=1086054 RepID=X8J0I5_9AGAM|nr:F-box protein [Rhizoctonia solani AG-3 Rhs1AP]
MSVTAGALFTTYFPNEVLVHILHHCDCRTIIRFSRTCKNFYETVGQSTSLQLQIELEISGLEIADRFSSNGENYSSILKELQTYRDAWLDFRLNPEVQELTLHPTIRYPRWNLQNGIYIRGFRESEKEYQGDTRIDRIQLMDIYSHIVPPTLDCGKKFDDYAVDVSQDLVVLFVNMRESSSYAYVHMCHTATGLPHPLARLPTFTIRFDNYRKLAGANIIILGSILVIKFAGGPPISDCCLASIWDWQSGLLLGNIYMEAEDNDVEVAFLDKNHLFVYSTLSDSVTEFQKPNQVALFFYRIPASITPSNQGPPCADFQVPSYPILIPILVLELPKLHDTYELNGYAIMSEPYLGGLAYQGSAKVFHSHMTTIALYLWVKRRTRPRSGVDYCVFVNTDRIFDYLLENRTHETMRIPWSHWGATNARWFTDNNSLVACPGATCGSRFSVWDFGPQNTDQSMAILEFNPRIIGRHMCSSGTIDKTTVPEGWGPILGHAFNMDNLKSLLESLHLLQETVTEVVGRDMKTFIHTGFEEPVESTLPYMVVIRQDIPRNQTWYLQSNCLVGFVSTTSKGIYAQFQLTVHISSLACLPKSGAKSYNFCLLPWTSYSVTSRMYISACSSYKLQVLHCRYIG